MQHDAQQARFLRRRQADEGVDQQQQEEQKQFGQNLQKALQSYGNKTKKRDIQSQVQYFGNIIEPFNMRQQEDMGEIDQEGFFLFKRRNQYKDAWLESIEEDNDMMVADKVKKRIKTEGAGWRGVYDDVRKQEDQPGEIKQEDQNQGQQEESQNQPQQQQELQQQQEQNPTITLQPIQIKQLLCQLLPMNKSANSYIKELKKKIKDPETKQLHDKILQLCNLYIEKTSEYDILTSKKEQLEEEVGGGGVQEEEESEGLNWDQDENEEKEEDQKAERQKNQRVENASRKMQQEKRNHDPIQLNSKNNNQSNDQDDDIF